MLALFTTATVAARARADGYFSGTSGARAAGRGGAFVAKADDLSAVTHNPAGLARLEERWLLHLGNRFSHNAQSFERAPTLDWGNTDGGIPPYVEFASVENEKPWQLLEPIAGAATSFGLTDWGFALAASAPAGIGRLEYPVDGGERYMMVSREALMLSYSASAAWKHGDVFGLGVSAQWLHVPRLRYQLVIDANQFPGRANPVNSELDMLATTSGSDPFTLQAVLGAWYRPAPYLELALSGQVIPADVHADSTLEIDPLSPEIDEEVVLRRDGTAASDVVLSLPLPITAQLGVRYRHLVGGHELFDIELDVGYASWSRVERFTLQTDDLVANLLAQRVRLGTIEIDKQWRDSLSVRLGGDYALSPELTLRAGVFHETAVAAREYAHVDFVGGAQTGGALGASLRVLGVEVALAYQFRVQPNVRVAEGDAEVFQEVPASQCEAPYTDSDRCHPQYLGRPAPPVNAGSYAANSHALSLDLLYRM